MGEIKDVEAGTAPPTGDTVGHVERLDELFGITGWAVDHADPSRPVTLELWAGDRLIASVETNEERPDVCAALGVTARPGFSFTEEMLAALRLAAMEGLGGDVAVRTAGSAGALPSLAAPRTLEAVRLRVLSGVPGNSDALLDRLSAHAQAARRTFDQPLRPLPGRAMGFVEAVAVDESGLAWLVGWMQDETLRDRPVVVMDIGKHAAGFAYSLFPREDLPPGSKGFVGVLHTNWRPSPHVPPFVFMADGSQRFLETVSPTPIRTRQALAPLVRDLLGQSEDDFRDLLLDLFRTVHSWSLPEDGASADMVRIDELAILPGFGALVKGWALSPSKEADRFVLKAGNRIIVAEPRSVSRHERLDLAGIYPNVGQALDSAGFVATFRDAMEDVPAEDMIVKATWNDGSSSNTAVSPTVVRMLGVTAPIESARRFYPTLEAESFFPDFAGHAARQAQARARAVHVYEARSSAGVVVLAAPDAPSDLFLSIDRAIRHAALLPEDCGIAIVARDGNTRALLLSLFAELKRATRRPCSLFLTRGSTPSNDALPAVLETLGADRFAYVGPNVLLGEAGWAAAGADMPGLTLFVVVDPTIPADPGRADLSAFAADRVTWGSLAASAPPRIGGIALPINAEHRRIPDAAVALGNRRAPSLVQRINQAIGAHHG